MSSARFPEGPRIPGLLWGLKRAWIFVPVASLYLVLSLTVHLRLWSDFDLTTIEFLQRLVPRSADLGLSVFSLIGSVEVTGLVVLIYAAFACPPSSRIRLVVLFVLIALVEWLGKSLIYQPGPPHNYYRYVLPLSFPTSGVHTPFSFPSGHSARTVFLTIVLVIWIREIRVGASIKRMLLGLLAMGEVVMLLSRASLGEHWPTDVIGGALLAGALALPWLSSLESRSLARHPELSPPSGSPGD